MPTVRWTTGQRLANISEVRSEPIVKRPLHIGESVSFGMRGSADRYLFGDDCHLAETDFRWAKRMVCRVAFNALFDGPVALVVRQQVMIERPWNELQLAVTLNGERLAIRRRIEQPDILKLIVQNSLKPPIWTNTLIFYSRLAIVSEIVGGSDTRAVGIGLKELHFDRDA